VRVRCVLASASRYSPGNRGEGSRHTRRFVPIFVGIAGHPSSICGTLLDDDGPETLLFQAVAFRLIRICKQEVAGSIPAGSTSKTPLEPLADDARRDQFLISMERVLGTLTTAAM